MTEISALTVSRYGFETVTYSLPEYDLIQKVAVSWCKAPRSFANNRLVQLMHATGDNKLTQLDVHENLLDVPDGILEELLTKPLHVLGGILNAVRDGRILDMREVEVDE